MWLQRVPESSVEVHFDGRIEEQWHDQYHSVRHKDYTSITAIPTTCASPAWTARASACCGCGRPENDKFDMKLFNGGNYMRAMEQQAMGRGHHQGALPPRTTTPTASCCAFPSSTSWCPPPSRIIRRHLMTHGDLDELPNLAAIHLNDTPTPCWHPRNDAGDAGRVRLRLGRRWDIVKRTVAYTNHTVMSEALETWNRDLFKMRLPRIYQIVEEIDRRFWNEMRARGVDEAKIYRMAPLNDGYVKMANLAVIGSHCVNGVSALHSEILKDSLFHDFYVEEPQKFTNVTNGIATGGGSTSPTPSWPA